MAITPEQAEIAMKLRSVLPQRVIWKKVLGFSEKECDEIEKAVWDERFENDGESYRTRRQQWLLDHGLATNELPATETEDDE